MQIFSDFRKHSLLIKSIAISVFSVLLINSIIFYIQPFTADTIFEYYTKGYFTFTSSFIREIFSYTYISFGDTIYILLALYITVQIIEILFYLVTRKFKKTFKTSFNLFGLIIIVWFLLVSQWNWNYLQPKLEDKWKLDKSDYSVEELATFTKKLIQETKKTKDNSELESLGKSNNSIIEMSFIGYESLAQKDDFFRYSNPSIKYSLFSSVLPYLGISGYYNPFTAEAQITKGIPSVQIPFVINHEIAHQLGIASEAEANFIGYLASVYNPISKVQYSGNLNLLMYCLSDLRIRKYNDYDKITSSIPKSIKDDINTIYSYWSGYRNSYRKFFDSGYDTFLKSNKQKEGLKSYNKVVSLAIFYNRKK